MKFVQDAYEYEGEFKNGFFDGKGLLKFKGEEILKGVFKFDKLLEGTCVDDKNGKEYDLVIDGETFIKVGKK